MKTYQASNRGRDVVLIQIEAVFNSSFLSPLSLDPDDLIRLTSGHFLVGNLLSVSLELDLQNITINRQQIPDHSKEYIILEALAE